MKKESKIFRDAFSLSDSTIYSMQIMTPFLTLKSPMCLVQPQSIICNLKTCLMSFFCYLLFSSQDVKDSSSYGRLTSQCWRGQEDLDIEEKILRRREMTHLFQWYYPEGGWGWVILICAFLSQTLAHGFQLSFSYPLGIAIR